ncbi:hypothetical protein FRC00_011139 [Tulasnella sp. 408]|nr:hypothetical protein FRC00_011139 [Tulasnella sp. 408]
MDANDMAHADSQGFSANNWAVGSMQDDPDELGYHMGNHPRSQETNIPSQSDRPTKQDAPISIHSLPTELLLEVILTVSARKSTKSIINSPEILKVALKRSSGRPLDIVLYADTLYKGQESTDHLDWFLDILGSHVDRWRSMDITYPPLWTDTINAALEEPALNLEKLSLWAEDKIYSTEEIDFFAGTAPRLNNLTLNGVSICWDSEAIHNLTALDLSYIDFPSTDEILSALSHSPHLRTLIIDRCTTGMMTNASSPSIQLLHLSVLQVDLGTLEATEDFLSHMEDDRDDAPLLLLSRRKKPSGIPELESAEDIDLQQPLT